MSSRTALLTAILALSAVDTLSRMLERLPEFENVSVTDVATVGDPARLFFNVNSAADLAEGIIAGTARPAFAYAEGQARYTWHDLKTTAKKQGDVYVLNGHKAVVAGGPSATHFIVTARTGGELQLVRQNLEGASAAASPAQGKEVQVGWRPEHAAAVQGKATNKEDSP